MGNRRIGGDRIEGARQALTLGWPRYDRRHLTLSGGRWQADHPRDHLHVDRLAPDQALAVTARTAGLALADTAIVGHLDRPRRIGVVALGNDNLSASALYRLRLYGGTGASAGIVHDTGWLRRWPQVIGLGDTSLGREGAWSGAAIEHGRGQRHHWLIVLPRVVGAGAIRLEIDDQRNADGYIEAGALIVSDAWELGTNYNEITAGPSTASDLTDLGGTRIAPPDPLPRTIEARVGLADREEVGRYLLPMLDDIGRGVPVAVHPDPAGVLHQPWEDMIATLDDIQAPSRSLPRHQSYRLRFREVL